MSDSIISAIARAAAIGVVLLGLVIAGYGVYLLAVGITVVSTPAVPLGTSPGPASSEAVPVMMGVIPAIAGALILIGFALRRIWLAWVGAAAALLFAGLYVFSIGGILIPLVAVLFVLLGVATRTRVNRTSPSSIG